MNFVSLALLGVAAAFSVTGQSTGISDGAYCPDEGAEPAHSQAILLHRKIRPHASSALSEDVGQKAQGVSFSSASSLAASPPAMRDTKATQRERHTSRALAMWPFLVITAFLVINLGKLLMPFIAKCRSMWPWRQVGPVGPVSPPPYQLFSEQAAKEHQFETWFDLLPETESPLLLEVDQEGADRQRSPLSFAKLRLFADGLALSRFGISKADRVCTMMRNGPEAAVCFLVFPTRCTFAPLNPALTEAEVDFEFEDLPCHSLVLMGNALHQAMPLKVAKRRGVQVLDLTPSVDVVGLFRLEMHPESSQKFGSLDKDIWSGRHDVAMVLHTSGTTKKPKIVPLTHENLIVGALCMKSTLQRQAKDICLNLMPLYHLHGISVNVLVSALSGASVICSPGYEGPAAAFKLLVASNISPSWYSAVPTMHLGIVDFGEAKACEGDVVPKHLEFIRNCSAALVPVVAERMETFWQCAVIPTYGMTESLPIASNLLPPYYRSLRSVGVAAGPRLNLLTEHGLEPTQGAEGEVVVTGYCVTKGYEFRSHMSEDPNIEGFTSEGMLRTGDEGYMDTDGLLCLSGRFKEIINRAGEKISPFEVENAMRSCKQIQDCMAFVVPHVQLGETVGLAAVLSDSCPAPGLLMELRNSIRDSGLLDDKWMPECLVCMAQIPKGPTGKPARIDLQKRLGLPMLDATDENGMYKVWNFCDKSGRAVALAQQPSTIPTPSPTSKVVDSLGLCRSMSLDEGQVSTVIHALYGACLMQVVWRHAAYGRYYTEPNPIASKSWAWRLAILDFSHSTRPTAVFIMILGYMEGTSLCFQFKRGARELALFFIVWLVGHDVLHELLTAAWYLITGVTLSPPAYVAPDGIIEWVFPEYQRRLGSWFLVFVPVARLVMVALHRLGVPWWIHIAVSLALGPLSLLGGLPDPALLWPFRRGLVTHLSYNYALLVLSAYCAPGAVAWARKILKGWRLMAARAAALVYLTLHTYFYLSDGKQYDSRVGFDADPNSDATGHLRALVFDILWTAALATLLSAGCVVFEVLGKFALGAYLLGGILFEEVAWHEGLNIHGLQLLPAIRSFEAESSLPFFLIVWCVYVYITCLFTGWFFGFLHQGLVTAGGMLMSWCSFCGSMSLDSCRKA